MMPLTATSFQSPMAGLVGYSGPNSLVSQYYNGQNTIFPGYHAGVDYSSASGDGDIGDSIRAAGHGTIVYAGYHSVSYGNVIMIRHTLANGQAVTTIYAHLDSISVRSGDVIQGQVIGTLGDANGQYAAHLHFAVHMGALTSVPPGYTSQPDATLTSTGSVDPIWFLSNYGRTGLDLYGTSTNDSGRNAIYGQSQNDFISSSGGNDYVDGRGGNDTIYGGTGNDSVYGSAGRDSLFGGDNSDLIYGGSEADIIVGGTGRDVQYGGQGADDFDFNAINESGVGVLIRDAIMDFERGVDDIDVSTIDASTRASGNQAFVYIGTSAFSGLSGELRMTGGVVSGDINGDRVADFEISVRGALESINTLSASDFIL